MSSHREAPEISKDPGRGQLRPVRVRQPGPPGHRHADRELRAAAAAGQRARTSSSSATTCCTRSTSTPTATGAPDLTYQFRFRTELRNDRTFLYNTGPIESLDSENWNRRQFFSVTRVDASGKHTVLAQKLPCPPCNVGQLSIPDYDALAKDAVHKLKTGEKVFAGQRADAFFVDLGAIFDLGTLRPFQNAHLVGQKLFNYAGKAVNATDKMNVHSIAIQVPLHMRAQGRQEEGARPRPGRGDRRVDLGEPPPGAGAPGRQGQRGRVRRPADAGLPARQPAVQRGHRADGAEGPVEQPAAQRGQAVRRVRRAARSWARCCRCCTRACSTTWPR